MRKLLLACTLGVFALSITACSQEEKKSEIANGATKTCDLYFAEVDSLIAKASEKQDVKTKLDAMKDQLENAKKEIADLPQDQQDEACEKGIEQMKELKLALDPSH